MKRRATNSRPQTDGHLPLERRLHLRDQFFRQTIESRELLQPFDRIPGVIYFVKDADSRLMAISPAAVKPLGAQSEDQIIGLKPHEFMAKEIADDYLAGDRRVLESGKPVLNLVEIGVTPQGGWDWIITDKYPLRGAAGAIVGLVGITQSFEARRTLLAHLGPVGTAADFISKHLGEPLPLGDIAHHTGLSQRQLQRLFRRVFGMTIHQFILRSRIHAATQELMHTNRSIAEIAVMFGFSDQSALSNRFREVTGMSPRSYRERYVTQMTP